MGSRRESRVIAMHVLYTFDVCGLSIEESWDAFFEKYDSTKADKVNKFARQLIDGVVKNMEYIDAQISNSAKNWDINRMASVDRTVLRIASFELLYLTEIPVKVIINEAVEVVKNYSTKDSGKFINGVLDKIKLKRPKSSQ
ncbi:transcription antitermination factor NusB [bacterium]